MFQKSKIKLILRLSTALVLILVAGLNSEANAQEPAKVSDAFFIKAHGAAVNSLVFHPSGQIVCSGGHDGKYTTWNVSLLQDRRRKPASKSVQLATKEYLISERKLSDHVAALAYNTNGTFLVASGVTQWGNGFGSSLQVMTPIRAEPYTFDPRAAWTYSCADINLNSSLVAMGGLNDELKVVSFALEKVDEKGNPAPSLAASTAPNLPGAVRRVRFHPTNPLILACSGDSGWVRWYNVNTVGLSQVSTKFVPSHDASSKVTGLAFTPDGSKLLSAANDDKLNVIDFSDGRVTKTLTLGEKGIHWIDVHEKHPLVAIAGDSGVGKLLNYESGETIALLTGHIGAMLTIDFSPDGNWIASGGEDGTIRLWEIKNLLPKKGRRR